MIEIKNKFMSLKKQDEPVWLSFLSLQADFEWDLDFLQSHTTMINYFGLSDLDRTVEI
jgi:hypothetical protein